MQHCQQAIYVTDNHCADCGEKLNEKPQLLSVEDIHPGVLDKLKKISPDAQMLTGIIKSMFYYKRQYKNANDNMLYGFWWLEVEDKNGVMHQFNIDAEKEILADLKKGDTITVFQPTQLFLTHKIATKEAKRKVLNNDFYPIVTAHFASSQRRSWDSAVNDKYQGSTGLWFIISLVMMIGLLCFTELEFLHATLLTLPVLIGILFMEIRRNKKEKLKKYTFYNYAKEVAEQILSTSKHQLGYDRLSRAHTNADIMCSGCQKRISSEALHCYECGEKQPHNTSDSPEKTAHLSSNNEHVAHVTKPSSIAELETELMREFSSEYNNTYTHKNILGRNESGKIFHQTMLGKVIDKSQDAKSSQSERTVTRTYTTETYRGGVHVDTNETVHTDTYRNRHTSLSGELTLSTASGKIYTLNASEDIIGSVDLGDWIFYAYSNLETTHYNERYREYCHNITKQLNYQSSSVTEFSMSKGVGLTILLGIIAAACTAYFEPRDYFRAMKEFLPANTLWQLEQYPFILDNIHFFPIALFCLFILLVAPIATIYAMINSSRLGRSVSKLKKMISKFQREYESVAQRINKLN
ncbi:hypothetical protein CWB85_08975 [Pseudoalteromonas sp. S1727]|uniref:hypothetical protein n=1 Tax=Pseudoalteromonas sp. S1727 TaxID=2066514 RepID=UPI0011098E41|nr:hypothetical protein [Pseudoalteromonas sp. S1727]TMN71983.1 hypothetical protein CWB85_08975 [Pseudoalteromonas sp. S1727]